MNTEPKYSFMSPEEFARLGERCFGFGWQPTFARQVGYNRVQINRYAVAAEPIPPHIALAMRTLAEKLDRGEPIFDPKPVGQFIDGRFVPILLTTG